MLASAYVNDRLKEVWVLLAWPGWLSMGERKWNLPLFAHFLPFCFTSEVGAVGYWSLSRVIPCVIMGSDKPLAYFLHGVPWSKHSVSASWKSLLTHESAKHLSGISVKPKKGVYCMLQPWMMVSSSENKTNCCVSLWNWRSWMLAESILFSWLGSQGRPIDKDFLMPFLGMLKYGFCSSFIN